MDSASELLACYQTALIYILHAREIPGISANDLENFRAGSRISAYTCRLRLCPRATVGFESAGARDEHEIGHARKFSCTFASCQYPAFNSSQTLKRHMREKHSTIETPRRTIRRPGTRYQRENDGGLGIFSQSDRPPRHRRDKVKDSTVTPRAHNSHSDHAERGRPLTSGGNYPSFNPGDTVAQMTSVTRPQAGLTETHTPQRDDERQSLSHTYRGRVQAMAQGPMEHASHTEDLKQQDDEQQVLSETEKAEIETMAQELMQNATYDEELRMVQDFQNRLTTDELEQMEARGGDRLVMAFQEEAKKRYMVARLDQDINDLFDSKLDSGPFPSPGGMPAAELATTSGATTRYERYSGDVRGWMKCHKPQEDARSPTDAKRHNSSPFKASSSLAPPGSSTVSPRATIMPMTDYNVEGRSGLWDVADSMQQVDFATDSNIMNWPDFDDFEQRAQQRDPGVADTG